MPRRAALRGWAKGRTTEQVREDLATLFVQVLTDVQASHGMVARWMKKTKRTIGRYARGETAIDWEAVLSTPQIGPRFLRCVVVHERKARRV